MTNLSNKLAIKAGSWKELNQVTDVYIKDFPEVVKAAKHAVSGKVVDAGGAAIEGATVRLDKTKVKTGADGTFSFADIEEGEHTLSIAKEGYEDVSQQVTVSGANLRHRSHHPEQNRSGRLRNAEDREDGSSD